MKNVTFLLILSISSFFAAASDLKDVSFEVKGHECISEINQNIKLSDYSKQLAKNMKFIAGRFETSITINSEQLIGLITESITVENSIETRNTIAGFKVDRSNINNGSLVISIIGSPEVRSRSVGTYLYNVFTGSTSEYRKLSSRNASLFQELLEMDVLNFKGIVKD